MIKAMEPRELLLKSAQHFHMQSTFQACDILRGVVLMFQLVGTMAKGRNNGQQSYETQQHQQHQMFRPKRDVAKQPPRRQSRTMEATASETNAEEHERIALD